MAPHLQWLLLIHQVPPKPDYLRVKVRRRLRQVGAVAVKSTVYALPNGDQAVEDFEWILREIVDSGGQGAICVAEFVGGLNEGEIESLFRAERAGDYEAITAEARRLGERASTEECRDDVRTALVRLRKRQRQLQAVDFVGSPEALTAEAKISEVEKRLEGRTPMVKAHRQQQQVDKLPRGAVWVTRKGVYIDRIASAWLIRRFIDPKASFKFVAGRGYMPAKNELRFDMFEGEYTHEGERCTFEVLLERFQLRDPALSAIGEIVHDLDMKDEKHRRPETAGIEQAIAGIAMAHKTDDVRVERGCAVLDDLHVYLTKKAPRRGAARSMDRRAKS